MDQHLWIGLGLFSAPGVLVLFVFRDSPRRLLWIVTGVVGFPAAAIASLYFVGIPVMLATGAVGYGLRRWGIWPHLIGSAAVCLYVALVAWDLVSRGARGAPLPDEFTAEIAIAVSISAALAASGKLGVMIADRGRDS